MTEENSTVPVCARTCSVLLIAMKKSIKMTPLGITSNSGVIITLQTERCASAWVFSHSKYVGESKHVCVAQAAPQGIFIGDHAAFSLFLYDARTSSLISIFRYVSNFIC